MVTEPIPAASERQWRSWPRLYIWTCSMVLHWSACWVFFFFSQKCSSLSVGVLKYRRGQHMKILNGNFWEYAESRREGLQMTHKKFSYSKIHKIYIPCWLDHFSQWSHIDFAFLVSVCSVCHGDQGDQKICSCVDCRPELLFPLCFKKNPPWSQLQKHATPPLQMIIALLPWTPLSWSA